jgi:hypothetical protein
MESIFSKDPSSRNPTVLERIGPEISHLHKGGATAREGVRSSKVGAWIASIGLISLLALFLMDPFLYAIHKSEAIRAYLYLHNYDSTAATHSLVSTGIFSKDEIMVMNDRHGSYQSYFSSPAEAEETAATVVGFMNGLHDLHNGHYLQLDAIGKLRYLLFVRIGLNPPTTWSGLNPSVN